MNSKKLNVKKLLQAALPSVYGINGSIHAVPKLCSVYKLPNPENLANIIGTVDAFHVMHVDIVRDDPATVAKLSAIQRHLDTVIDASEAIMKLEPVKLLGGTLVAINTERNIFQVFDLFHTLQASMRFEPGEPGEPAASVLEGFVIPLGEYWYDCHGTVPEGAFMDAAQGFAPVKKSAAAFVVDALASTSWKFSNERVKTAFEAMQRNLTGRYDNGELPVSSANSETFR